MSSNVINLATQIPKVADFTAYLPSSQTLEEQFRMLSRQDNLPASFDIDAEICDPTGEVAPGGPRRIHGCRCFRGESWSLTIRQKSKHGLSPKPDWNTSVALKTKYSATDDADPAFLNSFGEVCRTLYHLIFSKKQSGTTGMVVVTGGTGCGKSNIIRGLIDIYLRTPSNIRVWFERDRVPHLVTFEDPIESGLFDDLKINPKERWVDYTPRQRDMDVAALSDAIKSALRQTPAVFYVGEVRDIKDWEALLDFAGTGHLIFATSHASSLVEAMGKIFNATGSKSPGGRAIVADRLAALVHLRTHRISINETADEPHPDSQTVRSEVTPSPQPFVKNIVIPSLWRRTVVGAKALMAEGQSSLLPQTESGLEAQSCFGRASFAAQLWSCAKARTTTELTISASTATLARSNDSPRQDTAGTPQGLIGLFQQKLNETCIEWDLEGL